MVHDADIAATLMNRWGISGNSRDSTLELLKEGRLQFTIERGLFESGVPSFRHGIEFECLLFGDGSRVLRLVDSNKASGLTPWSSVAPAKAMPHAASLGAANRGNHDRPRTDSTTLFAD
ncbi:conserved protein of unknown function (plasmid) [Pararobbsia alpina]